LRHPWFVEADT